MRRRSVPTSLLPLCAAPALAVAAFVFATTSVGAQTSRPVPESERGAPGDPPRAAPPGSSTPGPKAPPGGVPPGSSSPPAAQPKSSTPANPAPGAPGGPQAKGQPPKGPPPIAVEQPRTAAEREKALNDLYALLATAEDATKAKSVSTNIERLWASSGSATIAVLMERAAQAQAAKNSALAIKLLDAVVDLAPDFAEGWNRRAYLHFTDNNIERALGDLRRVLALDPNHYRALEALTHILKEVGQKKAALAAVRKLLDVHPYWEGAKALHDELAREVEGQAL